MTRRTINVYFTDDLPPWRFRLQQWVCLRLALLLGATVEVVRD